MNDDTVYENYNPNTNANTGPQAGETITLAAAALDAPGDSPAGIVSIAFFADGQPLGSPVLTTGGSVAEIDVPLSPVDLGLHHFTAVATDVSGTTGASPAITLNVQPARPRLQWITPVDHGLFQPGDPLMLAANATPGGNGSPVATLTYTAQVPGQASSVVVATLTAAGQANPTAPWNFSWVVPAGASSVGSWTLTATAVDSAGAATSQSATIHVVADVSDHLMADITSPGDTDIVKGPVSIIGTVSSPVVREYAVQIRSLIPGGNPAWTTISSGVGSVTNGVLGTFDPTQRENGPYELQLIVNTLDGSLYEIPGPHVVLDGNMKIGHFALAFEDLSVPMQGMNIIFTRSYDSRRADTSDFGVGWDLAVSSMRVTKNRPLATDYVTEPSGSINFQGTSMPLWSSGAPLKKIVTITLPDGTALAFRGRLETHSSVRDFIGFGALTDPTTSLIAQQQLKLAFIPIGQTRGKLEPIDPTGVTIAYPQYNDGPFGLGAGQNGVVRI